MHHPPFGVGKPALDEIALGAGDTAALAALLERSPQVLARALRPQHQAAFAVVGGCGGVHLLRACT